MQKKSTTMIIFLLLFLSVSLGAIFLDVNEFLFMLLASFINALVALYTRPMIGFAILIASVLGYGFYIVGSTWGNEMNIGVQGIQIFKQCIFTLSVIAAWFIIYSINTMRDHLLRLEKEAAELRKLEPFTGILTYNEFLEEARLLITGMRRRKEKAYYLFFHVRQKKEYQQRVVYEKLTKLLLQSIRAHFDLVGNAGDGKVVVFLSNTNEDGVHVVLNRLFQKIEKEDNLTLNDFEYEIHDVPDDFSVFCQAIALWKRGKAS